MAEIDVYVQLADHLSLLGMGYPPTEDLVEILRENFSPAEVEVALAIPTRVIPLQPVKVDEIIGGVSLNRAELMDEKLVIRKSKYQTWSRDYRTGSRTYKSDEDRYVDDGASGTAEQYERDVSQRSSETGQCLPRNKTQHHDSQSDTQDSDDDSGYHYAAGNYLTSILGL